MTQNGSVWSYRGVSRRATLRGGALLGGAGLSAAFLAACGGDSNEGGSTTTGGAAGTLVTATAQAASTKQPKPGGALSSQLPSPPPTLDPYTQTSFINSYVNGLTYSRLYRTNTGVPETAPGDLTMVPDLAQALPEQVDPTTLTVKIKQAKWPAVAPVNGRAMTSEDVRYAIDRYASFDKSVHRPLWGFLDRVETPDAQTVTFKLKFPYADAVQIMGGNLGAYLSPKEFAETPEAAAKMLGNGPFLFGDYQTGTSVSYRKNPDYHDKPFPYIDEFRFFITTDQAKRVADFSARSVDLTYLFLPEERDQLKRNRPDAKFEETQGIGSYIYLRTDRPPFNDKRVRQALSMGINRKALRDVLTKGEGVDDQAVFVGLEGWAKPVKELAGGKYWEYNPAEAKQLLAAAGTPSIETTWNHADAAIYTQAYVDFATLIQAQWKEIGVNAVDRQAPYAQYISTTYQGNYEGIGHSPRTIPYYLDSISDRFLWTPAGRARINLSYVNDPRLNALLDKQRAQYDTAERKKTINELQDLISEEQWEIYGPTDTRTYFWTPEVENYRPSGFYPYTNPIRAWRER